MISKISLANWKCHLNSKLEFSEGTNCFIGRIGVGKSLPYKELVLVKEKMWSKEEIGKIVEKTLKKAKNIQKKDDMVYTRDNPFRVIVQSLDMKTLKIRPKKVTAFIKHKSPKSLIKIRTRTGKSVTVTKDHSVLILKNNGNIVPCKGSDIKTGDFLPAMKRWKVNDFIDNIDTSNILSDFRATSSILKGLKLVGDGLTYKQAAEITNTSSWTLDNWRRRKMSHKPDMFIGRNLKQAIDKEITNLNDFARLAGAFTSEGHGEYDEFKSSYSIKITNYHNAFVREIERSLKNAFPCFSSNVINNDIQINGKIITALFSRLFGSNAGNKQIPDIIYNLDDTALSNFLMMYFEGDGWVSGNEELACSSKSLILLDGIQTLLSRWGIISKIRKKNVKGKLYYTLNILSKHIPIFADNVQFLTNGKQKKMRNILDVLSKRKRLDGIDIIPNIKDFLASLIHEYHLCSKKKPRMRSLAAEFYTYIHHENMGREKLKKSLQVIFNEFKFKTDTFKDLERIVNSDMFFDEIIEVKEEKTTSEYVYDLSVDGTENFVAGIGNLIVHNSSILDGICFALFGTFPQLQQKKIKLEDVVMKKPEKKKKAEVELTFEIDKDEYRVKRIIEVNRSKAELRKDGKILEVQPKKVTEEIENILKIDYDLFTRAIYSEQNQLDMFLTIPKGQRMKKIDDLLKLEKFEKARTTTISLINRFKISQKEKQGLIENMEKDEVIKNMDIIKKELEKLLKEKTELGDKINSVKKDKENIKIKLEELKEIQKKLQSISEEKTILFSINKQLESDLSELKDIQLDIKEDLLEKLSSEINDLEEKLDKEKDEFEIKKQEFANNKARKEILEEKILEIKEKIQERKEIEKLLKKKDELIKKLEDENKKIEENQNHFRLANLKISQLKNSIKQLGGVDKNCPTCFQELSQEKKDKLIEKNKKQIKELNKQSKQYEKTLKKLSQEKLELEEKVNEIRLSESRLKTLPEKQEKGKLEKELKTLKEQIDEKELNKLEKNIDLYYKKLDELKSEKDKIKNVLEKKAELEKKQEIFNSNKEKINKLEEKQLKLKKDFSEEKLNNLEKGFEDIIGIEKQIEAKLENIDLIKNEKEKRLEEIENKKNLLEEYKNKLKKEKILKEQLELLEKMLVLTQEQLRKNFVVAINQTMHSIWDELYPYGDFSSIRLAIDGDYTLQLQDNNGWFSVDVVSGGERSIACLVLRIAFALILAPQLRWLVLDEPTHNLDERAINELAKVLREKITEFVDQIFLITHDPALEEAVSGFLYRIEREKEKNGFAKIVKI